MLREDSLIASPQIKGYNEKTLFEQMEASLGSLDDVDGDMSQVLPLALTPIT